MKYDNRYVLFLDILGFKKLVLESEQDKTNSKMKDLHTALSIIQGFTDGKSSRKATQFSDSIVISFRQEDNYDLVKLLDEIIDLLVVMIHKGIICRGAISFGKFYHDDKILFGPALVDAYETETKAAMYPRIILDKSIIRIFKLDRIINTRNKLTKGSVNQFLKEDFDDRLYIDYFEYPVLKVANQNDYVKYLLKLRDIISTESAKAKTADIKVKYGWMKHKFNSVLNSDFVLNSIKSNIDSNVYDDFLKVKRLN
jgi:hypothetical protein